MSKKLSIVGGGIKTLSHLTREAKSHVEHADIVLYLVNEPIIEQWIAKNSNKSKGLKDVYFSQENRADSYSSIKESILLELQNFDYVCVWLYGHPTMFSKPGLDAILEAELSGVETKIVPGISAEDCLFADLKIDPSDCGCYSVEATDLLIYQRLIDNSSHLVIWQVGMIGCFGHDDGNENTFMLFEYLSKYYSGSHVVTLYEASIYPGIEYRHKRIKLNQLSKEKISKIATLYVPPSIKKAPNKEVLHQLGLE